MVHASSVEETMFVIAIDRVYAKVYTRLKDQFSYLSNQFTTIHVHNIS